jgi:UPF0176 protein
MRMKRTMMLNKCQPHECMSNLASVLKLTCLCFSSKVGTRFFLAGQAMRITNIAGYKFIILTDLAEVREVILEVCTRMDCRGTVLLSQEGINLNLAGDSEAIATVREFFQRDVRFSDMTFRVSRSETSPFKFMKVKIRKEIITMRRPDIQPELQRAPAISPQQLKVWLDEKREITLLDTRNEYEVRFGTFENATQAGINDFSDFPQAATKLKSDVPVVMFCTGGIRCEKAALHLRNAGHEEVYQLDGGILNYFAEVGGAHYQGECFVFDQRVSLDTALNQSGTQQCVSCEGPMVAGAECHVCASRKIA